MGMLIRVGLWGILYYKHCKEPPTIVLVTIEAPTGLRLTLTVHVPNRGSFQDSFKGYTKKVQ